MERSLLDVNSWEVAGVAWLERRLSGNPILVANNYGILSNQGGKIGLINRIWRAIRSLAERPHRTLLGSQLSP